MAELSVRTTNVCDQKWRRQRARTIIELISILWDLEILARPNWESTQLTSIGKGPINGPYKVWLMPSWWISFSKFSDVSPAFTCASAISKLWSICLGVIYSFSLFFLFSYWKYFAFKAINNFLSSFKKRLCLFRSHCFFSFLAGFFGLVDSLNLSISSLGFISFSNRSFSVITQQ